MITSKSLPIDFASFTVQDLAARAGLAYSTLSGLAKVIDQSGYHRFVDRKNGKARVFAEPTPMLKQVQRNLLETFFSALPVSSHVYNRRGQDVVKHAQRHVGRSYLLSMDLRDCFPNTTTAMVRRTLSALGLSSEVVGLVTRLVTYNGQLPQGSPCSSAVVDCVLFSLDEAIAGLASEHSATYTRWLDDFSFSADAPLATLYRSVKRLVRAHGYSVNHRKTRKSRPGQIHTVTGIAVGSTLHAPREYLVRLDREIDSFSRAKTPDRERALYGKIQWVSRLNLSEGAKLHQKMQRATVRRAAPALPDSRASSTS